MCKSRITAYMTFNFTKNSSKLIDWIYACDKAIIKLEIYDLGAFQWPKHPINIFGAQKNFDFFWKKKFDFLKKTFSKIEIFFPQKIKILSWPKIFLYAKLTTGRPPNRKILNFWLHCPSKRSLITIYHIYMGVCVEECGIMWQHNQLVIWFWVILTIFDRFWHFVIFLANYTI